MTPSAQINALFSSFGHQSQLLPALNKFHKGNSQDGKHYWLTPWEEPAIAQLVADYGPFDFDPCPFPKPEGFDGLTCEWGQRNWVNPPFGSIMHQGKKKGPTAWMRKAIEEQTKGKLSVVVYPVDKLVLMMLKATGAVNIRNLGDVRWLAIQDGSKGKGTGRHIAAFILLPNAQINLSNNCPEMCPEIDFWTRQGLSNNRCPEIPLKGDDSGQTSIGWTSPHAPKFVQQF